MNMPCFTPFALAAALLATSTTAFADSRNAPPPPGDDYADSYGYGYGDNGGYPPPQGNYDQRGYDYGYQDQRDQRTRTGAQIGGALVGGGIGAIAGSAIAGHGNRLEGALIGGGVGAIAGVGIASLATRHHHGDERRYGRAPTMGYDYGTTDANVMYQGHWVGSMTGSWNGGPVRTWEGTFDSTNGQTHWQGQYVSGNAGYAPRPMMNHGYNGGYNGGYRARSYGYGYGRPVYGYAMPMYEEVLVPSQPIITRTVTTRVTYVDVAERAHYVTKRVWRPVRHRCVKPVSCPIQGS